METRLSRYLAMAEKLRGTEHYPADETGILMLRSLTDEEAIALDRERRFPSDDRIEEIATQAGCSPETVASVMRGWWFKMNEGLRFKSP